MFNYPVLVKFTFIMKKLLFSILVLLAGCSESEDPKKALQVVTYTDVSGSWEFVINEEAKGSFTISAIDGGYRLTSGEFVVFGSSFTVGKAHDITFLSNGRISDIFLETFEDYDQPNYSRIHLEGLKITLDYTEMVTSRVQYYVFEKGDGGESPITITRPTK